MNIYSVKGTNTPRTIFWLAGESSGDMHAAVVMRQLNKEIPYLRHVGIGGPAMQEHGLKTLFPFKRFAVMGFVEVIKHLRFFYDVEKAIKRYFREEKPDLVVLVDYPGLNLRIACMADDERIPVLYFICPQFWAWKHHRVFKLRDHTRHVACILPFEKELLDIHNTLCTYVGHPIAEEVEFKLDRASFANFYGLDTDKCWIGFFPGSRDNEVEKLLPVYLETIKLLDSSRCQFLFSKARSISHSKYMRILEQHTGIRPFIIDAYNYELLRYCDALVLKSGTTTLEAAFIGTPAVIVYKANPISYHLGRYFVKLKYIGLPNIILDKRVEPELIQDAANPRDIAACVTRYLDDEAYTRSVRQDLSQIRHLLGDRITSVETSAIIKSMLGL